MNEDIRESVMRAIHSGRVTRRSSFYFIMRLVLLVVATAFVLALSLYVTSLAMFVGIHETIMPPPGGSKHVVHTMISLPWLLVALMLMLVGLLEWFSREFSFIYHRPIIYTFFIAVMIISALGSILIQTEIHERASELSKQRKLPLMGPVYRYYLHMEEEEKKEHAQRKPIPSQKRERDE